MTFSTHETFAFFEAFVTLSPIEISHPFHLHWPIIDPALSTGHQSRVLIARDRRSEERRVGKVWSTWGENVTYNAKSEGAEANVSSMSSLGHLDRELGKVGLSEVFFPQTVTILIIVNDLFNS